MTEYDGECDEYDESKSQTLDHREHNTSCYPFLSLALLNVFIIFCHSYSSTIHQYDQAKTSSKLRLHILFFFFFSTEI